MSDSKINEDFREIEQLKNDDIEFQSLPSEEVKSLFLTGMSSTGGIDVITITHSQGSMLPGRLELFQKQAEITKKYRGSANVRYAWLDLSKEALPSVLTYGLGPAGLLKSKASYGIGVDLVAANLSGIRL